MLNARTFIFRINVEATVFIEYLNPHDFNAYTAWYFTEWKISLHKHCFVGAMIIFISHCSMHVEGWSWFGSLMRNLSYTNLKKWKLKAAWRQGNCFDMSIYAKRFDGKCSDTPIVFQRQVTLRLYNDHTCYLWSFRHNFTPGQHFANKLHAAMCVYHEEIGRFIQQIEFSTCFHYILNEFVSADMSLIWH